MEKVKIYELAKELNTTSKRLIEKLSEINIDVKNHMSYLNEQEVEALYKHIGMVAYDPESKNDSQKKAPVFSSQPKIEPFKQETKNVKNSPRIIRTTEIYFDEKVVDKFAAEKEDAVHKEEHHERNKNGFKGDKKYGGVKVNTAGTGLRTGFVRDTGLEAKMKDKQVRENKSRIEAHNVEQAYAKSEISERKSKTDILNRDEQSTKKKENQAVNDKFNMIDEKQEALETPELRARQDLKKDLDSHEDKKQLIQHDLPETQSIQEKQITKEGKENKTEEITSVDDTANIITRKETQPQRETRYSREKYEKRNERIEKDEKGGSKGNITGKPGYANKKPAEMATNQNRIGKSDNSTFKNRGQTKGYDASLKETKHGTGKTGVLDMPLPSVDMEFEETKGHDYKNKDLEKDKKREQKREVPKTVPVLKSKKKFKTHEIMVEEGKDVTEMITEDILANGIYNGQKTKRMPKLIKHKTQEDNSPKNIEQPKVQKYMKPMIKLPENITVKELAEILKKSSADVIKKLMNLGLLATINQEIDYDSAAVVAEEFGFTVEKEMVINEEDILFDNNEDKKEDLEERPPVVVVMGHVDHGKTSLLDAIRKTNVIDSEEGGITQHIGAYTVNINGRNITFLDTPGHEAFTAMRARGAQVTDIAILVVAADDGVMPQTVEAINHAKAANVAIIVAINKIDKPGANVERVKQQLTEYGLIPEEWGGNTVVVPVSALKHENIDLLLEMILLTADMLELKANPKKQAKGTIIEAKLDKNRGPLVTLLVQRGTLNVGDTIISGAILCKIRAMYDDKGQSIKSAGPSSPVEVLGFPEVPDTGEVFYVVKDEKTAKSLIEKRKETYKNEYLKGTGIKVSLDDLFNQIQEGKVKELNLIIKADVQGSTEALKRALENLSNTDVKINIIHSGVGGITESDVKLADVSNAIIIGFNVRPGPNVLEIAKNSNVDIRLYRIIYEAIEDIQAAMKGMLEPKLEEVIQGHAEIRQLFRASEIGIIGGSYVLDGKILRNSDIRILRNGIVVHEGKLASLKRFKDDVREVSQGYECGILVDKFNDIKEGDIIEAYMIQQIRE